jgi:hypothetical protein
LREREGVYLWFRDEVDDADKFEEEGRVDEDEVDDDCCCCCC